MTIIHHTYIDKNDPGSENMKRKGHGVDVNTVRGLEQGQKPAGDSRQRSIDGRLFHLAAISGAHNRAAVAVPVGRHQDPSAAAV